MTDRPSPSRSPAVVVAVGGLALVGALILAEATGNEYGWGETIFFGSALVYFLVLGTLILRRVPGNRIGWVFAAMGFSIGLSGIVGDLASDQDVFLLAAASAFWLAWIALVPLLIFWYPTGRRPTGRWRLVELVILGGLGITVFAALFAERICLEGDNGVCRLSADNPVGIPGLGHPEYSGILVALFVVMFVGSLVSVVARYRKAATVERLQLKWFVLAASLIVVSIGAETFYSALLGIEEPAWVGWMATVGIISIPIAATVAILRYGLFEIERIISRTVTYALVAGLLAGLVAIVATVVGTRFIDPVIVAATTLAVAALFNPIRRRVQALVDRRFNRARYDAERVMEAFAGSLRDQVDQETVLAGWLEVVGATMAPSRLMVWVRR